MHLVSELATLALSLLGATQVVKLENGRELTVKLGDPLSLAVSVVSLVVAVAALIVVLLQRSEGRNALRVTVASVLREQMASAATETVTQAAYRRVTNAVLRKWVPAVYEEIEKEMKAHLGQELPEA
jgi:hypothetical protein